MAVKPATAPSVTASSDKVDPKVLEGILNNQQTFAENSFWGAFAYDSTMSLLNGIFQWQMMSIADENADADRALRGTMEQHAYELNGRVVDYQSALANKIEDNKVEITRLESRERTKVAQIQEDAKTERKRNEQRLLPFYPIGTPVGPRTV